MLVGGIMQRDVMELLLRVLNINMRVDTPKCVLLNTYIYLCSA